MNWKKFLKNIIYKLKRIWHTIESCYLCSRFVFLYPRNRWTGKHWQSWKLDEYLYGERNLWRSNEDKGVWGKAFVHVKDPNGKYDFQVIRKTISYPWAAWFWVVWFVAEWILPIFHCIPTYTELDEMEPGWRKAFGIQMCDEIKVALKKNHYLYKYRIMQIKEKFGTLRWYDDGAPQEVCDIINKYEDLSWNTCIVCGKPSELISSGWISPYCRDHYPEHDPIVYQVKIGDHWEETKEYQKAWEEIDKQYAKNTKEI